MIFHRLPIKDDGGVCGNCLMDLDLGCECTEQEREEGPTLQDREEEYWADKGEELYQRECEERERTK